MGVEPLFHMTQKSPLPKEKRVRNWSAADRGQQRVARDPRGRVKFYLIVAGIPSRKQYILPTRCGLKLSTGPTDTRGTSTL